MKTLITGHRPKNLYGYDTKSSYIPITKELERIIQKLKPDTIITSCSQGVEMIAGSIACRTEGVRSMLCLPCTDYSNKWDDTGIFSKQTYNSIFRNSDEIKYVHNREYQGPTDIFTCNKVMVERADNVVVVYRHDLDYAAKHKTSGTAGLIRYAMKLGKDIIHHNPATGITIMRKGGK